MKPKKDKKHTTPNQTNIPNHIIAASILIIISTIIYTFEISGKTFYLRYIITLIATTILFDALYLKHQHKIFTTLKNTTIAITLFIISALIYFILTLP